MTLLEGVALLEKLSLGEDLEVSEFKPGSVYLALFLLPADSDVELITPFPASRLPVCCEAAHQDDNGPLNCKSATMKCFPLEELLWPWCPFTTKTDPASKNK